MEWFFLRLQVKEFSSYLNEIFWFSYCTCTRSYLHKSSYLCSPVNRCTLLQIFLFFYISCCITNRAFHDALFHHDLRISPDRFPRMKLLPEWQVEQLPTEVLQRISFFQSSLDLSNEFSDFHRSLLEFNLMLFCLT